MKFSKKDILRAYAVGYLDGLESNIDTKKIVFIGMARKGLGEIINQAGRIKAPRAKGKVEG